MVSSTSPKSMMIAGNWKMFKNTQEAVSFTESLAQLCLSIPVNALPDVVLCVPFTLLQVVESTVKKLNAPFIVAAQTMESRDQGAYTGEISPLMLKDIGIQTVVIGHSERRQYFNETD
ncbi:MAG: triose-phosphate isomerase, partial [Cyanobacteria bacterium]|nr:triose-phosphate isomerase [Cyanobacteriota bacterium]